MKRLFVSLMLCVGVLFFLSGLDLRPVDAEPEPDKVGKLTHDGLLELTWADLIPADFHPEEILEKNDFSKLEDFDPRAQEIYKEYLAEVGKAPTVPELQGRTVKIPGFVVPLETDGQVTAEFLLVPYFGACIHVPPPPANQIVHVRAVGKGTVAARKWYDTVWVIGRMTLEPLENEIGTAGYTLEAERIEPYEEPSAQ